MSARNLAGALLINAGLGVLYIWSLFLEPFETELSTDRGTLSSVPALALVFFTVGMVFHSAALRRTSPATLATISLGLAGASHVLVGLFPGVPGLLVGYGLLFGVGGGLGYLLALGLATHSEPHVRGIVVGVTVATFAASGIVLAFFIPALIARSGASTTFLYVGVALLLAAIVANLLLRGSTLEVEHGKRSEGPFLGPLFFKIAIGFFTVCAVGLMVVAHSTGILVSLGAQDAAAYAPISYNAGYIIGCLAGGKLAEQLGGRGALSLVCAIMLVALVALALPMPLAIYLVAIAFLGATLGGIASLTPMLIAGYYGVDRVGSIYGKLNIAYGLGGLIAPWFAGVLYVKTGGYTAAILTGIVLAVIGVGASLTIPSKRQPA